MDLPKFHETFIPLLKILSDRNILHYNDLRKRVRDKYYSDLPDELLRKKNITGANVLLNRIGWAKSSLKQGKFLFYPERAMVQITDKGMSVLKSGGLTLRELKKDSDYLAYQKAKKAAKESKNEEIEIENASPQDLIDSGFSAIELQVKNDLLERLKDIDPYYFEKVILILLQKMGYGDFIETSKSGDGGIDGIINEDKLGLEKIFIQAKRYNENKVREKEIRNFIGAMSGYTSKGVFVTTSNFDELAIKKAREAHHSIILIDGNKLVDLMHQYGVGVQVKSIYEVKEIDEDFFEEN
ncbi:MAG: restriction endonuclease [Melioribacteraceae bacterium]